MESLKEAMQLISQAKNVCLVPSQNNEPESLACALALFYTLKELNKNANLIIENLPEKLNFLIPSLDFISTPKNFVISIPRNLAEISQVFYEKSEESLKIHLAIDKGQIKKEQISFYFSQPRPDVVITLGIKNLQSQLQEHLDSFGFILDVPILNIDNEDSPPILSSEKNKKFGNINLISDKSLSETTLNLIKSLGEHLITKYIANCILTGLVIHYQHLKSSKTSPETFQLFNELMKNGGDYHQIINSLQKTDKKEINFLYNIFQNLQIMENYEISLAQLDSGEFQNFGAEESEAAVEKLRVIGVQGDLLVLWASHASNPTVRGFLYSKNQTLINKLASLHNLAGQVAKSGWIFISLLEPDINLAKEKILANLNLRPTD